MKSGSSPKHTADSGKARIVTIDANQHGQRLDNFLLAILKGVPKSHVYRLLRSGQVRVNSGRKKPHYRLKDGDRVRIPPVRVAEKTAPSIAGKLVAQLENSILLDNEHVLVVNKPAGIPVHGGSGYAFGVIDILRQSRPEQPLELAHRLDRETSGCLLLAKSRVSLNACHAAFREQHDSAVAKHYLALVKGHWPGQQTIGIGIEKVVRSGERMMQASEDGARAVSHFECQQQFEHDGLQASLMRVQIETGRTHQIRAHARYQGHPLAGDEKYGDKTFNNQMKALGLNRLFLHASRLQLDLPGTGRIEAEAALPEELLNVLNVLE